MDANATEALLRRAISDFSAEAAAQIDGLSRQQNPDSMETARDHIIDRLVSSSLPLTVTEDAVEALMVHGHLRRNEAIRALLIEREIRLLSRTHPSVVDQIAALTDRIRVSGSEERVEDATVNVGKCRKRRSCSPVLDLDSRERSKRFRMRDFDGLVDNGATKHKRRSKPAKMKSNAR